MPIKLNDIKVGYEYKAGQNQDRVVLGYRKDGRVVYASRGGNVKNAYTQRESCQKPRFAKACHSKGQKFNALTIQGIIKKTNAHLLIGN